MVAAKLSVHVEADLFDEAGAQVLERRTPGSDGRRQTADGRKRKSKAAAFLSDFRDLKPGDFVVHIDHGIGRFGGLQMLDLGTRSSEFHAAFYAEDDQAIMCRFERSLVPTHSSARATTTARFGLVDSAGRNKAKAKRAMRDMADELLRLYAERKLVGGYAFANDPPWQREFEDVFEYVLTPIRKQLSKM